MKREKPIYERPSLSALPLVTEGCFAQSPGETMESNDIEGIKETTYSWY